MTGSGRIRYNDILDPKIAKKLGKKQKPQDILSIRFGEGYKKKSQNDQESDDDELE